MTRLLSTKEVRSSKERRCCLCGLIIRKRAKHVQQACVSYGDFYSNRYHAVCFHIACVSYADDEWESHDDSCFRQYDLKLPLIGHKEHP
jgi:hypothetical protein